MNRVETAMVTSPSLVELTRHGLVVLGSLTRIQGDYLLAVAAKPIPAGGER